MPKVALKLKSRTWIALGLLLLLVPIALVAMRVPSDVDAVWFDDSYAYRRKITFTHNASVSDRRVDISIDTATLTTDKMQADCDDTRFTDLNGALLRFQEVSGCDSGTTVYDIVLPSINNGTNVFYIYYGNPGAINASQDVSSVTDLGVPSGGVPSVSGTEEKTVGPVSYWRFDEGVDNSCSGGTNDACDSATLVNDGANSGVTWKTEDQCVKGKCLYFDGTNDFVNIGDVQAYTDFTYSVWIRPNTMTDYGHIFQTDLGHLSTTASNTFYYFSWDNRAGTGAGKTNTTGSFTFNKWHHVAVVASSTTTLKLYVDGKLISSSFVSDTPSSNYTDDMIGTLDSDSASAIRFFKGFMDEMKIYNYARTDAQIMSDYLAGAGSEGSSATFGSANQKFLSDGLVGYWPMDETSLDTCPVVALHDFCDKSGNGHDASANSATISSTAKFGGASVFDGVNDSLSVFDHASLDVTVLTISAWVRPTATSGRIVDKITAGGTNGYVMDLLSGNLRICANACVSSSGTVATSTYSHVVATFDGTTTRLYINGMQDTTSSSITNVPTNALNLLIGLASDSSADYTGQIDEVRIYNRALSPSEVQALYNWAPGPVGYWNHDEGSGTATLDRSGSAIGGTVTNATWINGKYGNALNLDGSGDFVSMGDSLDSVFAKADGQFSFSVWVKPNTTMTNNMIITKIADSTCSANQRQFYLQLGTDSKPAFGFYPAALDGTNTKAVLGSTAVTDTSKWYHLGVVYDGSLDTNSGLDRVTLYVNGIKESTTLEINTGSLGDIQNGTAHFGLGARLTAAGVACEGSTYFNGSIDDVKVYDYLRTSGQIIEDMNGGHPLGGSPVGSQMLWYKFDEQSGQTVNNSGSAGTSVTGIIGSTTSSESIDPTWKTQSNCKVNGCLSFGGDDYVTVNAGATLKNQTQATITAWVNAGSFTGDPGIYTETTSSPGFTRIGLYLTSSGKVRLALRDTAQDPSGSATTIDGNTTLSTGTWYHLAVVFDSIADTHKIYVNGKLDKTDTTAFSALGSSTAAGIRIGDLANPSNFYTGSVDELKIYSTALTQEQVQIDMNAGSSISFGTTAASEASQLADGAGNPSVAEWKFDEDSGTSTNDTSGNGNTGTITGASWVNGKVGPALSFDGTNDKVTITDSTSLDGATGASQARTLTAWIKFTSTATMVISEKGSANHFYLVTSSLDPGRIFWSCKTGSASDVQSNSNALNNGSWHHVAGVFSGSILKMYIDGVLQTETNNIGGTCPADDNADLLLGQRSGDVTPFAGQVDDMKIYDYERSAAQIAYDYNRGLPIGHWRFDECSGTTAYDASGNGFNGTIIPGADGNTAAGDCQSGTATHMWADGATGKLNSGIGLDALSDYISIADNSTLDMTGDMTIMAWVNTSTSGVARIAVSKYDSAADRGWLLAKQATTNFATFDGRAGAATYYSCTGTTSLATSTWKHITGVRSGSNFMIYVDGRLENTCAANSGSFANAKNLEIGRNSDGSGGDYFHEIIDDVRLYNYALSGDQIKKVMNDNSGARFGPSTGQP